jgi:hypothetical protein
MIVKNNKAFSAGAFLAVTFFGVLILIFSPIFGEGKNGLVYSDDMFNRLSKGSSYFIPKVAKSNEAIKGTQVSLVIKLEKAEQGDSALKVLTAAGRMPTTCLRMTERKSPTVTIWTKKRQ